MPVRVGRPTNIILSVLGFTQGPNIMCCQSDPEGEQRSLLFGYRTMFRRECWQHAPMGAAAVLGAKPLHSAAAVVNAAAGAGSTAADMIFLEQVHSHLCAV